MAGAARGCLHATLALALAAVAGPACYRPTPGECQLACTAASGCPAELTCGADGFCHGAGDTFACGGNDGPAPDAAAPDTSPGDGPGPDGPPLAPVDDLAAGNRHACAIRAGVLSCWGDNRRGQLGVPLTTRRTGTPQVVGAATDWEHVAAGLNHTCGIRAGAVWCFGSSSSGQTGAPVGMTSSSPTPVRDSGGIALTNATEVCAGAAHSCAIVGGALMCWGSDSDGQLGDGVTGDGGQRAAAVEVLTGAPRVWSHVACGVTHTCAIASDDAVYCWGEDAHGMLGRTVTGADHDAPTDLAVLGGAARVAVGDTFSCALTLTSGLSCWGYYEDTAHPTPTSALPSGVTGVATMSAARDGGCVTDGASTRCFGDGSDGELGDGLFAYRRTYGGPVEGAPGVERLASGTRFSCAALADRSIRCWGKNSDGQLGLGQYATGYEPRVVPHATGWRKVVAGAGGTCAIDLADRVYCWGRGTLVPDDPAAAVDVPTAVGASTWRDVAVGTDHACAIPLLGDGATCWGDGLYGRLGNNIDAIDELPPAPVQGAAGALPTLGAIAAGDHTSAATGAALGLYGWGDGADGRLGLTPTTHYLKATQVSAAALRAVGLGYDFGCAINASSAVACWGSDEVGQQGNGAGRVDAATPVTLGTTTLVQLSVGPRSRYACGVGGVGAAAPGPILCWGASDLGQAGAGGGVVASPTQVGASTTWTQVAVGETTTCALAVDGERWCWGDNDADAQQFGRDDAGGSAAAPQALGGAWAQLALGAGHGCAIDTASAALWCWGQSRFGETGVAGARYHATAQAILAPQ